MEFTVLTKRIQIYNTISKLLLEIKHKITNNCINNRLNN